MYDHQETLCRHDPSYGTLRSRGPLKISMHPFSDTTILAGPLHIKHNTALGTLFRYLGNHAMSAWRDERSLAEEIMYSDCMRTRRAYATSRRDPSCPGQ